MSLRGVSNNDRLTHANHLAPDISGGRDAPSVETPIACLRGVAQVDVPSEITGVSLRGEPHHKGAYVGARPPPSEAYQPIKGFVENRRVGRRSKRNGLTPVPVVLWPNTRDGTRSGSGIVCVTADCLPKGRETSIGDGTRESTVDPKETFFDKLVHLRCCQHVLCSAVQR